MNSPELSLVKRQSDYLNPHRKTVQLTSVSVFIPTGSMTDKTALHLTDMKDVSVGTVTSSKCDVTWQNTHLKTTGWDCVCGTLWSLFHITEESTMNVCLHVCHLSAQHLAEWHHVSLQQKLSQVQLFCWISLRSVSGAHCVAGLPPFQGSRLTFFTTVPKNKFNHPEVNGKPSQNQMLFLYFVKQDRVCLGPPHHLISPCSCMSVLTIYFKD